MSGKQISSPPVVVDNEDPEVAGNELAGRGEIVDSGGVEESAVSLRKPDIEVTATEPDPDGPLVAVIDDSGEGQPRWFARHWGSLIVAVVLIASAVGAGSVYWWMYRPDQLTNSAAQQQVRDAAKDGTTSLLSYAPETLDKDLSTAKSHLTGEFLTYYSKFTDEIVAPAARQKGVKTEATVVRSAVSEMHPDRAVVLVFVNQVTTSKDRPEPALATSSVMITLVKGDGHWLISEFKPV